MSLFIDASALVAIIAGEPEQEALATAAADADRAFWSPMSCWEAVSALRRSYDMSIERARQEVELIAARLGLSLMPIGAIELDQALDAYARFGKGRHRAQLNMGDCFAYACAKAQGARLLYKGDDFKHTDLA